MAETLALLTGTIMRTVALAPRFLRNGSGLPDRLVGDATPAGRTLPIEGGTSDEGGASDAGGATDPPTAGRPMTVFFRGGLEEYPLIGGLGSDCGGGVTTGGGLIEAPAGGTNPWTVCRGPGRPVGVFKTRPGLTEGLA